MDINVNLHIQAPALVDALNALVTSMSAKVVPATTSVEEPKKSRSNKGQVEKVALEEKKPEVVVKEVTEEVVTADKTAEQEKTYSLEVVQSKLRELARNGKQAQVKALITAAGAERLTDIPVEKYAELMAKAEKL